MADMDDVIKGLESLREMIRTAKKYTFTSGGICAMSMGIIDDALALLKKQDAKMRQLRLALDIAKGTCNGIRVNTEGR